MTAGDLQATGPADDPRSRSWVRGADRSGYPIQNLAFGACRLGERRFLGVRIGDQVLDLAAAAAAGVFDDLDDPAQHATRGPDLDRLLAAGRPAWSALRRRLGALLVLDAPEAEAVAPCLVDVDAVTLAMPFTVADFVDFYSSIDHASNIGRMFRPDAEPLLENWRHLPVGYHGRSGTVVVSDTPVVRPRGQHRDGEHLRFGPSQRLDFELEVGFVVGASSAMGHPLPPTAVRDHVFGVVLVNDWSARDIQAWEYVPLGPFLGKSFATSISGWVVPLDALAPFRVPSPPQDPPVLPYLRTDEPWGLAVELAVDLRPAGHQRAVTVTEVGFDRTYWTVAQQLAHLTANGASTRPGDLFASGTVSGPTRRERGSLIELSWNGTEPLDLDGATRTFLADGDEVVLRGRCEREGHPSIELGSVCGVVVDRPH